MSQLDFFLLYIIIAFNLIKSFKNEFLLQNGYFFKKSHDKCIEKKKNFKSPIKKIE